MATKNTKAETHKSQTLKSLNRILVDLTNSPRYELLKRVPLAQFTGKKLTSQKALAGISVEQLVKLSKAEVSPLTALTILQLKHLVSSLWPLLGATAVEPMGSKSVKSDHSTSQEQELVSSVEVDIRLIDAQKRVKNSPLLLSSLKDKTLGDFWDKNWQRAPFEETLTFQQFADLDVAALQKKRSFTQKKGLLLIDAINLALGTKSLPKKQIVTVHEIPSSPTSLADVRAEKKGWGGDLLPPLPSYARELGGIIGKLIKDATALISPSPSAKIIRALPLHLGGEEFLTWWFSRNHSLPLVSKLLSKREEWIAGEVEKARRALCELVENEASEVAEYWRGTDVQDEVPEKFLFDPYIDKKLDRDLQRMVLRIVYEALVDDGLNAA